MAYERDRRRWTGFGKAIGVLLMAMQLSSIMTIVLAVSYASEVSKAPSDSALNTNSGSLEFAVIEYYVLSVVIPALIFFLVFKNLLLHIWNWFHPIYAIIISVFMMGLCCFQVGYWIRCDLVAAHGPTYRGSCVQAWKLRGAHGGLEGVSTPLTNASIAFAFILLIIQVIIFGLAIRACWNKYGTRKDKPGQNWHAGKPYTFVNQTQV